MFGGLDLAKVQSVIDDEGEMGPPEEGPKTVYKQMIQQLQNISQILLRTEATTKMLLAIDLERVRDTQSIDRQESVDLQDTDPPPPPEDEAGPGRFRRGVGAVGNMLGGAYSKVKGSLSGMLGVGALILGFKFFREEIEAVTAKIIEGFKAAYDYFTAEDFTMEKFQQDFGNIFWPKIQSIAMDFLDMLFTVIKESIFGTSGSTRIQQEAGDSAVTRNEITRLTDKAVLGGADLSKIKYNAFGVVTGTKLGPSEQVELYNAIADHVDVMSKISKESDGRIQWSTFPGYKFGEFSIGNIDEFVKLHPVSNFINAMPVIDGMPGTWESLKNINLDELAGIDRTMTDDRADKIRDVLRRMTLSYQDNQSNQTSEFLELQKEYEALNPVKLKTLAGVTYTGTGETTSQALNEAKSKVVTGVTSPFMVDASVSKGGDIYNSHTPVSMHVEANNNNQTVQALNAMGYV